MDVDRGSSAAGTLPGAHAILTTTFALLLPVVRPTLPPTSPVLVEVPLIHVIATPGLRVMAGASIGVLPPLAHLGGGKLRSSLLLYSKTVLFPSALSEVQLEGEMGGFFQGKWRRMKAISDGCAMVGKKL